MSSSGMARQWLILGVTLLLICGFIGWHLCANRSTTDASEREWLAQQARVVIDDNLRHQLIATDHGLDSIRNDLPFLKN